MKCIAASGFGLIVSIAVLFIMQYINAALYPIPTDLDLSRDEIYFNFVSEHPLFLFGILFSAAAGSFVGGAVAALTKIDLPSLYPLAIGVVLMVLGYVNIAMIPHPVWFWIGSLFVYLPFSWGGARYIYNLRTKSN